MKPEMEKELVDYCDELTEKGETLSVRWNGGGDDGQYEIVIDDKEVDEWNEMDEQLIDWISEVLGYYSFAGSYYTDGMITYNRKTKCFEGYDNYSEADTATTACEIPIEIPSDLWFDRLMIQVRVNDDDPEGNEVRFIINNGPILSEHYRLAKDIIKRIEHKICEQLQNIDNCSELWCNELVDRSEFHEFESKLSYIINELNYRYELTTQKEVNIELT